MREPRWSGFGVTSRSFAEKLEFTPLAEGLTQLALELCTTPDCGLPPPVAGPTGINDAGPEAGATG